MNKKIILKKRPVGFPAEDTWALQTTAVDEPKEGEILVETQYVSLDPAMRGWLNDQKSYIPPVQINDVMRAGTVGKIIQSKHPNFKEGDFVSGGGGVQQFYISDGKNEFKVDGHAVPLPKYLSVLGMTGMTAYFGILEVGKIKEGDIVLISGAAGAVGSVAGQIAKIKGCTVVGIAGGKEKCTYVVDHLGFDACIDYKNEQVYEKLKEYCPKGIDVYFDNVGGDILDLALAKIRRHARIVICGAISQYNATEIKGPKNYLSLLINRATMQGMVVFDYATRYQEAGMQMARWMAEGNLKSDEAIYEGIENFYDTFKRLFSGDKRGKLVLKVS